MNTQDENLLVKLIKKSVGLPTGQSCGCSRAPAAEKPASAAATECCEGEAATEAATESTNAQAKADETMRPSGA